MAVKSKKAPEPVLVHRLPSSLFNQQIRITLVGCGGNGSQMLTKLARLDFALRAIGRQGLDVTVYDPDIVSPANIGRQLFSTDDIGLHKSIVLVNRLNMGYGLAWRAYPTSYDPDARADNHSPHVLITCVDTARARADIWNKIRLMSSHLKPKYWLDLGNTRDSGQVILGQTPLTDEIVSASLPVDDWVRGGTPADGAKHLQKARDDLERKRLLCVTEIFPQLLDKRRKEDDTPSCSLAEALEKQSLFVNDAMVSWAAQLLDALLREGQISYHGVFVNLKNGAVRSLPVREHELPVKSRRSPRTGPVPVAQPTPMRRAA